MKKDTNKKKEPLLKLSKIIHLLGEILGLVIKEQEGVSFFNQVEKIRVLSKASRDKKNKPTGKLTVNIGTAIDPNNYPELIQNNNSEALLDIVMKEIAELVPSEYRGIYR